LRATSATPFPTRRSSDLLVRNEPVMDSWAIDRLVEWQAIVDQVGEHLRDRVRDGVAAGAPEHEGGAAGVEHQGGGHRARGALAPDRKSTRLNSSHVKISY